MDVVVDYKASACKNDAIKLREPDARRHLDQVVNPEYSLEDLTPSSDLLATC